MIKVMLSDKLRLFDDEGTSFSINKGQVKELQEAHLRSYAIRSYLFSGVLKVIEGSVRMDVKNAKCFISSKYPGKLYGYELNKFFEKDLEMDTIIWPLNIPQDVKDAILGKIETPVAEFPSFTTGNDKIVYYKSLKEIKEMTKDELNDYGHGIGFSKELNTYMTKKQMIEKLRELTNI